MKILEHQVDDGRIAYQWSHEPCEHPLVVLHGLGDSAIHTYAPRFARTVLTDVCTLFIDFPGFGEGCADLPYPSSIESMAADVADLLTSLHIHGTPTFAHSMGANVAIVLAHQYPDLVSTAVLAEPLFNRKQSVLAAGIAKHSEDSFLTRGYAMLVRATSMQAHRGDCAARAFLPTLKRANPVSMHRAAVSLLQQREPDFATLARSLPQPLTLLVGDKSQATTLHPDEGEIRIVRVPNAGHLLFVEQEDITACAILNSVN